MTPELLKKVVEGALLAAAKPMTIGQLQDLFEEEQKPSKEEFSAALEDIQTDMGDRGFELIEVASGWRFQVKQDMAPWISRLWEEKPKKYSRAMLETLALIAYRQPITRGDIEQIRGVAVSSEIIKTLLERDWVKVVGHKDVPGRPAMYATTKEFLDYFNLKSLEELPTLAEIRDLDSLNNELNLEASLPPIKPSLELKDEEPENKADEEQNPVANNETDTSDLDDDYNDDNTDIIDPVSIDEIPSDEEDQDLAEGHEESEKIE